MIAKLKLWGALALAFAAAILYGLWNREKAKRYQEKAKGLKEARDTERNATDAMVKGLENEENEKINPVDFTKRNHFGD